MYNRERQVETNRACREAALAKGLCGKCRKRPVYLETTRCLECVRIEKDSRNRIRQYRLGGGICIECGISYADVGFRTCTACRSKDSEQGKTKRKEIKAKVIEAYGGRCVCCGESEPAFLTLDHTNNDGSEHRKKMSQTSIYREVIRDGFPKDKFQQRSWNCNCGRQINGGVCPHKNKTATFVPYLSMSLRVRAA
jgi:hypothetical protein